jgi:hypothetical protein
MVVHQQIRARIVKWEGGSGGVPVPGSLPRLLALLERGTPDDGPYNLCIAGFSPIDPETFVFAIDHPDDDDGRTSRCLVAVRREFDADEETPTWTWLRNEPGALLKALRELGAEAAREVLLGTTADNRALVHVRTDGKDA